LGDGSDSSNDDDDNNVEIDAEMQDQRASSAKKVSSAKKPAAGKPDPTAAIASSLAATSLQSQPKLVWFSLSVQFPSLVSPTGYFWDGQMRCYVDFLAIGVQFENNYRVEISGKTLKLFMRIPPGFINPSHLNTELQGVLNDHDTIISAQRETASMVYCQHGNDGNILTPPQVVALPWEVENISFFKPI
jgi:hypothetical protein